MPTPKDLSSGTFIKHNGELSIITEIIHRTPGNLRAFYQAKMKVLKTGKSAEYRYRVDESVDIIRVERRMLQFIYMEGENMVCMDNVTFEQFFISKEMFGDSYKFLKEGNEVMVAFDGETAVFAEPPAFVELDVTYTEPGIKGDTATNTLKFATLETGAEIRVPLFINIGERIKIDTRDGSYSERVN